MKKIIGIALCTVMIYCIYDGNWIAAIGFFLSAIFYAALCADTMIDDTW